LSFQKILAIQHRQMGDVLMCTPALSILKKEIPLCRIDFLTENIGQQVLKYNTHIDKLIVVPRKPSVLETWQIISRLRGEKYDAVIDFFGNPRAGQLTLLSGARVRCGFRDASLAMAYSRKFSVRDENELKRIRQYIINNPPKWELDRNYTGNRHTVREPISQYNHEPWMV